MTIPTSQPIDVETEMLFLRREEKHNDEKPYKLRYDPGPDMSRTNCTNDTTEGILVQDIRGREHEYTIEKEGFTVRRLESKLGPEEFDDEEKVKEIYYAELRELLKKTFGATRVEVLEHGIRKRHPEFPVSIGTEYDFRQPASVVHIDFTPNAVNECSEHVLNIDPKPFKRIQSINIWKPLYGPVSDWPLGFCDVQTVNAETDLIDTDVVMRTGFTENYSVYFNPAQKWYYLNNQLADEVILFRQTDTDVRFATGVPHASFRNSKSQPSERPRESIESRAIIYY